MPVRTERERGRVTWLVQPRFVNDPFSDPAFVSHAYMDLFAGFDRLLLPLSTLAPHTPKWPFVTVGPFKFGACKREAPLKQG